MSYSIESADNLPTPHKPSFREVLERSYWLWIKDTAPEFADEIRSGRLSRQEILDRVYKMRVQYAETSDFFNFVEYSQVATDELFDGRVYA